MSLPRRFTDRELDVLEVMVRDDVQGNGKLAARALGVSIKTVEVHVANICEKMGVNSRLAMVLKWDRHQRPSADPKRCERCHVCGQDRVVGACG